MSRKAAVVCSLALAAVPRAVPAAETELGVWAHKLIAVDKLASGGGAKIVYLAKDCAIDKGAGTDLAQISMRADFSFVEVSGAGSVDIPAGAGSPGVPGWVANNATLAKFVNASAPGGPSEARTSVMKVGKLLKVVTRGLGVPAFDILDPGLSPDTGVSVLATIETANGADRIHHCSVLGCSYRLIANDTGAKLVCRNGAPDIGCSARNDACLTDLGATVEDTCRGLEWEKKDGADGFPGFGTPDPGNLRDVDNEYAWAGRCSIDTSVRCQPNAPAAAACAAQTVGGAGCVECGVGDGTCTISGVTTIWDWLVQLNAAAFSGHSDWRIPSVARQNLGADTCTRLTGDPAELETMADTRYEDPATVPVLGPSAREYWSATASAPSPPSAFTVLESFVFDHTKDQAFAVRAVRTAN